MSFALKKAARRVRVGAAMLDRHEPEWFKRIALDNLGMQSCEDCILGQLYGDYEEGLEVLAWRADSVVSGSDKGFSIASGECVSFGQLADLWRAEVRARLAAAGEATS